MTFRDWFFNQFPRYHRETDSYKDGNGEGVFQRYLRLFGLEIDEGIIPFIDNFMDLFDVVKAPTKFLPLLAGILGNPPTLNNQESTYRKLLAYIVSIYKIRGTLKSYQLLFNLFGLDVEIIEDIPGRRVVYDDPTVFYDKTYHYDQDCDFCSGYRIRYTQSSNNCNALSQPIVDAEELSTLNNIICFLNPINAVFNGFIRELKVCDEVDLHIGDLTNFCSNPQGVYGIYTEGSQSARIFWDSSGDFELHYRLLGSIPFIGQTITGSFGDIGPLLPDSIYEVRVRRHCSLGNYSNWVTILLFTSPGIINGSGAPVTLEDITYIRSAAPVSLISDYYLDMTLTNPIKVTEFHVNGHTLYPGVTINDASGMVAWLNSLNVGTFTLSGTKVISRSNENLLTQLVYLDLGSSNSISLEFQQLGQRTPGNTTTIESDYRISFDYTSPVEIVSIEVDGVVMPAGNQLISDQSQLLDWLNSLNVGTFIEDGGDIISVNNPRGFTLLTYKYTSDPQEYTVYFRQSDIRKFPGSLNGVFATYTMGLSVNDPGMFNIKITGLRIDDQDTVLNSPPLGDLNSIASWLNTLSLGTFILESGAVLTIKNSPKLWQTLSWEDLNTNEVQTGTFLQKNVYVGILQSSLELVVDIHTALAANGIYSLDMDAGTYDFIKLRFNNTSLVTGGTLYTDQYGQTVGYMDNGLLVFNNLILGGFTQIVIN